MILATNPTRRNCSFRNAAGAVTGPRYNRAMQAGILLLLAASVLSAADEALSRILDRVSEEAEVFRTTAPKTLAEEKLVQRSLKPPRRFRPRLGADAVAPPKPQYRTREVISEYGFAALKQTPGALHEFRQVISIDGRKVASPEKAHRRLLAGLRSDDDRAKQRLLEDFEEHGLRGAAADFGQVLLLFSRHRLADYQFTLSGRGQVGVDRATILSFKQIGGAGSLLIVGQRKVLHQPLEGQLWVSEKDSLPLRIVLASTRRDGQIEIREEATIDYLRTPLGYLAPASVVHREMSGNDLVVENRFEYSAFKIFKADADIKFK